MLGKSFHNCQGEEVTIGLLASSTNYEKVDARQNYAT
jgi:hypothetical protein